MNHLYTDLGTLLAVADAAALSDIPNSVNGQEDGVTAGRAAR